MGMQKREPDTHKGSYGHLFIIGGSPGLTGAVCLAAISALRSGCGIVTVALPDSLNYVAEVKLTEAMSLALPQTGRATFSRDAVEPALRFIEERADGVLIGNGISTDRETAVFTREIILRAEKPLVIDADAITAIAGDRDILKLLKAPAVITPHPGEMSRLAGLNVEEIQRDRSSQARRFASEYGLTVVLKGHHTVISDGKQVHTNLSGNPGMATAGTGDVLAGVIGSFMVKERSDLFSSAVFGVHIHGLAGDLAARVLGQESLIASDIIDFLPDAFRCGEL